tara:strand:+ start:17 stop:682 length:666 start_codon:yes stop_codon:yes gene_type:complete
MKLIKEINESVKVLTEENEDGKKSMFIEGIFLQGNIQNRNGRRYDSEILANEVNRYVNESVSKGRAYGELGHPDGPSINLDRVSHIITELRREGDNFIGKAKISSTPMGQIVEGLLSDGAQLGVSSRGMGSLKEGKDGVMEVQEDFYLATAADIVADPSAPDAFVNGIMEGVEWVWDHGKAVAMRVEDIERDAQKAVRQKKLDEQAKLRMFESFLNEISKV